MENEILSLVRSAFNFAISTFSEILSSTGMISVYVTAIVLFAFYKFILSPVFGMAHSDTIKKSYNAFKRKKED